MFEQLYTVNGLTTAFYISILGVVFLYLIQHYYQSFNFLKPYKQIFFYAFLAFLIILIGFRPVGGANGFADSPMYINWLNKAREGEFVTKDIGFGLIVYICSFFPNRILFVVCATLSIVLLFFTSKKVSNRNWFLFFMGFITMLYYWNHNVFSIRQGLGAALFTYGLLLDRKNAKYLLMLAAVLVHKSYLLPLVAYFLTLLDKLSVLHLLVLWFGSILVSYFFGNYFEWIIGYFVNLFDSRSIYFQLQVDDGYLYSRTGFRIDMIFYSFIFILFGLYYYLTEKTDNNYITFFKIFLITNIFFILILQVNQSYRFAYLSWFITPLLVYYPLLKSDKKIDNTYWVTLVAFLTLIIIYIPFKVFT